MDEEKVHALEQQLDEALLKVFELENKLKREALVRYELEDLVRNIYRACLSFKEEDEQPDRDTVLTSLAENIRKLAKEYHIEL